MIVDASPLIIFGKLNKIDILMKLFNKLEISEEVYKEAILKGLDKKFEDSLILKSYFESDRIKVIMLGDKYSQWADRIQHISHIHFGEAQTIALAKQLNRKELVIDEAPAREAAKSLGLKPIGSLRVLLFAYKRGLLSEKELKETINKMIKLKFRISAATLIRFWELFEKLKK